MGIASEASTGTYRVSMRPALLDPRTKMALLALLSVFCLAGTGGQHMGLLRAVLSAVPFVLMLLDRPTTYGAVLLCLLAASNVYLLSGPQGLAPVVEVLLLVVTSIATRLIPCLMMGSYTMDTTSVSEFCAAMERMHVPETITIPMCVMFRFFPTIRENATSIQEAMRMRGVGGANVAKLVEYRLVPLVEVTTRSGDDLAASALVRGLGAPVRRTNIARVGFRWTDALAVAMLVGAALLSWMVSA